MPVTYLTSIAHFESVVSTRAASIDATRVNMKRDQINNHRPVIIEFWAEWCEVCRSMSPHFAQLAAQNPAAQFYRLDIEDVRDVALALGVRNVRRSYDLIGTFRSRVFFQ